MELMEKHKIGPGLPEKNHNETVLHIAAREGFTDIPRLLLDAGLDSRAWTRDRIPLHHAAAAGKKDAVVVLLRHQPQTKTLIQGDS